MAVTKRTLGIGYLVGTGAVFSLILAAHIALGIRSGAVGALASISGLIPSVSLVSIRYWLPEHRFSDEQIWRLAKWGGLGLGLLTLVNTAIVLAHYFFAPVLSWGTSVVVGNVAVGGVGGVLVGALREQSDELRTLNQQNAVLNRVLRHDLRNAAGIVQAHVRILEDEVPGVDRDRTAVIRRNVDELVELSEAARGIQATLEHGDTPDQPVDLVACVEDGAALVRRAYPEATVALELPEEAWVSADPLLDSVVHNLVENAVAHNPDSDPWARVTVRIDDRSARVVLRVEDDGPGIPDEELDLVSGGRESPLDHSAGVGLWLVTWLVDHYGGDLSFERPDAGGTVVRVSLPAAPSP